MHFSVWAPKRKSVSLKLQDATHPMQGPDDRGWWNIDLDTGSAEVDYTFLLDDEQGPYPDPRSPYQPNGVHAASRTYNHTRFQWTDQNFRAAPLSAAIIYELHIGTFTPEGTFDAAIAHLDHLVSLGVTHVEFMPVAAFEGDHGWGYDGVALFAPHQPYGGPDGLKRLIDACHARGLAVVLDVVYNHFGPSGNYTGLYGQYLNHRHSTPWGGAVNFEAAGSDQVRRFFIDNALMWLRDYHVDGLRLDAVHEFVDRSAIHFLEQLSTEVEDLSATIGKQLVSIAESDLNDPRIVTPREANGYGIDAQWSDDFHHALHAVLTGEGSGYYEDFGSLDQLAKALTDVFVYNGIYSGHRSRIHGRPIGNLSYHHFLGYSQTHDQVGNRAQGDRLCHLVSFHRAQIAAALVLTSAFVPMLFQGEEWAASSPFQYFADHQDEELRHNVTRGRMEEFSAFGWKPEDVPDPESIETFQRSKLKWNEISKPPHKEMLDWYHKLIALRRSTPALNHADAGSVEVKIDNAAKTMQICRDAIQTCVNFGQNGSKFLLPDAAEILLSNGSSICSGNVLQLPPETVAVLRLSGRRP
ncbi:MAG: malto-oligosyltrehalose trehalohydrolase [Acidobacteria bacterium]|nr:malto-oligosyltrehalose trehalohydrolase [Acidobacteriota bacterium]